MYLNFLLAYQETLDALIHELYLLLQPRHLSFHGTYLITNIITFKQYTFKLFIIGFERDSIF